RATGFPLTVVRPSYTYGETWIPSGVGGHGYTIVARMRQGKPIISAGDGQNLWVMTHNTDFAVGFVGLFGQAAAIGEAFHITSDEVLTWDSIYRAIGHAAGCEPELVHLSTDFIAGICPELGPGLYGDKAHSVVFDNTKIKRVVPDFSARVTFGEGIARSLAWHDADPVHRHIINPRVDAMFDRLIAAHRGAIAAATASAPA
ncbi:MAG: NAD-dependent dehydratase, partial [Anaerolineales bacterium]